MNRQRGFRLEMPSTRFSNWGPGMNPDPSAILHEARADRRAGRFADALTKHVWFHENALKYVPSLSGVRLSFALTYWMELGAVYPAALRKLKRIRDDAERRAGETLCARSR